MIEKIYRNKYMVTCDNCGTGQECDSWADVMDFMNEEGWKKRLVDGEFKHYCPECQEGLKSYREMLERARKTLQDAWDDDGSAVIGNQILETINAIDALLELLEIKTTTYCNVVLCPKCKYACFSKTIEYAYVCKNKSSPCHNRTTFSDFGCVYGQKKEIEADV